MNLVSAFTLIAACCVTPSDFAFKNTIHIVDNSYATWLKPLANPGEKHAYIPVTSLDSPFTDEEIIYEAMTNCKNARKKIIDRNLLESLLQIEKNYGVPNSMRGMVLAAACSESGYNPFARGDRKFSKSKKKPMAIGMFQLWPIYEKMYPGLNRTDPIKSAQAWLGHIVKKIPKVKKQCRFRTEKKIWVAAWVTGIRYKKAGGRCYERPLHLRVLKKWHKNINNYRKDVLKCSMKGSDGCGC